MASEIGGQYASFSDLEGDALRQRVRASLHTVQYNVMDLYSTSGVWQLLARNLVFHRVHMVVTICYMAWMGVRVDIVHSIDSLPPWCRTADFIFLAFFSIQWLVRFMAFSQKRNALKDRWMVLDLALLIQMCASSVPELCQPIRMLSLLRCVPEITVLIKGMVTAMRSVFYTVVLLCVVTYFFAMALMRLTRGTSLGEHFFDSVPNSMLTLFFGGTLFNNLDDMMHLLKQEGLGGVCVVFIAFVILNTSCVVIMFGVVMEVVSSVASVEKEEMMIAEFTSKLGAVLSTLDSEGDGLISLQEFQRLLEIPEALRAMHEVGLDCVALIDFPDLIFPPEDGMDTRVPMQNVIEVLLKLRGTKTATVMDIMDLRKHVVRFTSQQTPRPASIDPPSSETPEPEVTVGTRLEEQIGNGLEERLHAVLLERLRPVQGLCDRMEKLEGLLPGLGERPGEAS